MSEVISSFKKVRIGSHVLAFLMLFLWHTMWSGKSLQLICILPFGMMFVKIMLAVCMLVGAKADSVSSVNCVQSASL